MKIQKISLSDSGGGLNDRDLASGIAQNEFQQLENYLTDDPGSYVDKRPGKEIIQYTPINPKPFVSDATTLALWHLDALDGSNFDDSGPNGLNMPVTQSDVPPVSPVQPGIFGGSFKLNGGGNIGNFVNFVSGNLPEATFEAWIYIDPTFSGQSQPDAVFGHLTNNGSPIVGLTSAVTGVFTGLQAYRGINVDPDTGEVTDALSAYVKFNFFTTDLRNVQYGYEKTLQTKDLPFAKWLHIRASYSVMTQNASIWVNGVLHQTGQWSAGYIVGSQGVGVGAVLFPGASPNGQIFKGLIDEARISTSIRGEDFPYELARGMGFEFAKSDGTRQCVLSATDKLWETLGDGSYTQMKFNIDGVASVPSFSTVDFWDAVFRKDILYLSNGVDNPVAWDGSSLVNWGIPVTPPTLTLSAVIATITAGVRRVYYTYLYGAYETGPSPYAEIANPSANQINVSGIPPRHANCTGVRIYMDKAATPGTFYLVREIPHTPGLSMSISGPYAAGSPSAAYNTDSGALGPADGSLGSAGYPLIDAGVATNIMPNAKYLLGEHDRIFFAGMQDDPYTLRWSQLGAPDVIGVFSFAQAAANQGNLIALASYYGEVHCSKDGRATLILRGSNPQNWKVLETLHPSIGAIDHWSYVHRYPFTNDNYVLCFAARDGFYKYAGQQIECISDKIKGTITRLAQGNATRNEWDVSSTAQFQAQHLNGGLTTQNVQADTYETDGLREFGGTAKIVDQLNYLGLWASGQPLVTGNVIAVCKDLSQSPSEGQFYFSTDASNALYWTPDNFVTVQMVTGSTLAVAERIIEIVRRNNEDFFFLVTDSANADPTNLSSAGGNIYTVSDPLGRAGIGPVFTTLTTAPLFYDLDVPFYMEGGVSGNASSPNSRTIGQTHNAPPSTGAPNNIFINHTQNIQLRITQQFGAHPFDRSTISTISLGLATGIQAPAIYGSVLNTTYDTTGGSGTRTFSPSIVSGFYSYYAFENNRNDNLNITELRASYTRREFPRWRGGSFAPQCYWDSNNARLVFLASTPEDVNGNRTTYLRTIDASGTLQNQYTFNNVSAFTSDGVNIYSYAVYTVDDGSRSGGFLSNILRSTLAVPSNMHTVGPTQANLIATRLSWNANSTAAYIGTFKSYGITYTPATPTAPASQAVTGAQEFWTYTSTIAKIPSGAFPLQVPAWLYALAPNGDFGAFFNEIAVQANNPYPWYVAVSKVAGSLAASPLYVVSASTLTVSVANGAPYQSPSGTGPVDGILSNLLFVPSSGLAGGNLWADRLYWWANAPQSSDARMLQLGVAGDWTVVGVLQSETHNLGTFNAFDNLASAFDNHGNSNGLIYEFRNAVDPAGLAAATYKLQPPNTKITGWAPVLPYVQWRLTFTWTYTATGIPITASPSVDFVNVGFFLGQANLPRTVGFHWEGRTFWTCAEDGAAENNVVLVYQKNSTWAKFYGWNLKSIFRFRNQMVGLEAYQLMRLMTGRTDAGALVVATARTGTIMGYVDKMLIRLQANLSAFADNLSSSLPGYVKIRPYQGADSMDAGSWVLPIPNGVEKEPNRALGVPEFGFTYAWARAYSLEIKTSTDTTGNFVPQLQQTENIQALDLELETTEDAYDIVVK